MTVGSKSAAPASGRMHIPDRVTNPIITDNEQMTDEVSSDVWVKRLIEASQQGEVVDLQVGESMEHSGPESVDQWASNRSIPASAIRTVLSCKQNKLDPNGLRIKGAHIIGLVDFANIDIDFPLHLINCAVDETIYLNNSKLRELTVSSSNIAGLNLEGSHITGALFARHVTAHGEIRGVGARIGGQLVLEDATLNNPDKIALNFDRSDVAGGINADNITAHGEIRALGARIGGQLVLEGATLNNPDKIALNFDRSDIAGGINADNITAHGEIRGICAQIDGQLVLEGATLNNPNGYALALDGATITGGMFADTTTANGKVCARGAEIRGQLVLTDATLNNPNGNALVLDGTTITGGIFAAPIAINGDVQARGAQFNDVLRILISASASDDSSKPALNLQSSAINQLSLPADSLAEVNLSSARIALLITPQTGEPKYQLVATGWEIGNIEGRIRTDHEAAARWLNTDPTPGAGPQPWIAIAEVYERNGHPADARRLRLKAANKVTKTAPLPSKLVRGVYLAIAGHGYYPLFAVVWLAAALIGGMVLVDANRVHFVPSTPRAAAEAAVTQGARTESAPPEVITGAADCSLYPLYPCMDTFSYALTGVIPAATGITRPDWSVSSTAPVLLKAGLAVLRILAWIFTAILLAGVTGLLKKSS